MYSLFTPTHNPQFLDDTFKSVVQQTRSDWEWVVVPNNGVEIPAHIVQHPQVRVVPAPDWVARLGVGALKRFACEQCNGDWFVELDHDDFLFPEALAELALAAAGGAGFVYSDCANFRSDNSSEVFDARYGWESYPVELDGVRYTAMRSFPADASSLHLIYYAPNHFRAWSRDAYVRSGGHDSTLPVVDDHDLVCRTYLAGVPFHHVPICLYLYRLIDGGQNTYIQRNAEIQSRQQSVSNKYVYSLIAEWARRSELPSYDLGGAHNCPPGFKSIDLEGADVNCDIQRGLPFADSSVGCIRAYDFLEHIPNCRDSTCTHGADGVSPRCVVGVMNEIYRVLAPGGWLISRTPSTDGRGAFQDPTHVSYWNPNSFWYYTRQEQARFVRGIACRYQATRIWQDYPSDWHKTNQILYVYADLVALKGQRQPGVVEI